MALLTYTTAQNIALRKKLSKGNSKMPNPARRLRKTIIIQSIIIFVLCIAIIAVSLGYFGQMRLNRFSKNIIFSDNYFLRDFASAYSSLSPSAPPSTYTVSEAEALTRILAKESGLFYAENLDVFAAYKPDRALDRFDILSYYYNYMIELFASHNTLYVLFSPEISAIIPRETPEDSFTFSQADAALYIDKLIERSLKWSPAEDNFLNEDVFYFEDRVMYETYFDPSYEEYIQKLKNKIISSAKHMLDANASHDTQYTAQDIYLLYYDSVAQNFLSHDKYLPAAVALELLEKYEYGNIRPRILDAEHISQLPEYPNGCEAVSAVMLLKYAGYNADKNEFVENHLEKGEIKIRFGIRFGPDPAKKYAGDPASKRGGWGCFAPAIVNALESYLEAEEKAAHTPFNVSGAELSMLCETFIDRSIPVAIWITQDYSPVSEVYQWLDYEGDQVYLYPKNQHCIILIGYDKDNYYVCDPLKDEACTAIARADAEVSYTSMGSQAVVLMPNEG